MSVENSSEITFQTYQPEYRRCEEVPEEKSTAVAFDRLSLLYTFCRDEREWANRVTAVDIRRCTFQYLASEKIDSSLPKVEKVFCSSIEILSLPSKPYEYVCSPKNLLQGDRAYRTPQELIERHKHLPDRVRDSVVCIEPYFRENVSISKEAMVQIAKLFPNLKEFWITAGVIESILPLLSLKKLEILGVSASILNQAPNFLGHPSLKVVYFDCKKLPRLPSFLGCPNLKKIQIKMCEETCTPLLLEDLPQLESLYINKCGVSRIRLISCPQVKSFEIYSCNNLNRIEGLKQLSELRNLVLNGCLNNEEVMLNVSYHPKLVQLLIALSEAITGVIGRFEDSTDLSTIKIIGCPKVEDLPEIINASKLQIFVVRNCSNTLRVRLQNCESLEKLKMVGIQQFKGDCWIDACPLLTEASWTPGKSHPNAEAIQQVKGSLSIRNLPTLSTICLAGIRQDNLALSVENCPEISTFTLTDCQFPFGRMRLLQPKKEQQSVKFTECEGSFIGFSDFNQEKTRLHLNFDTCMSLPDFSEMARARIDSLTIKSSHGGDGGLNFTTMCDLSSLTLKDLPRVSSVAFSKDNVSLSDVKVEDLPACRRIDGLETLSSLKTLCLNRTAIQELPSFSDRKRLRAVLLKDQPMLNHVGSFTSCYELSQVELINCPLLEIPPSFTDCVDLKKVSMPQSGVVTELPTYTNCPFHNRPSFYYESYFPYEYQVNGCAVQDLTQLPGIRIVEEGDDEYGARINKDFVHYNRSFYTQRTSYVAAFKNCATIRLSRVRGSKDFVKLTVFLKDGQHQDYCIDPKTAICYLYIPQKIEEEEAIGKIYATSLEGILIHNIAYNEHGVALIGRRGKQNVFFWGSPQDANLKEISPTREEEGRISSDGGMIYYFYYNKSWGPVINGKTARRLEGIA